MRMSATYQDQSGPPFAHAMGVRWRPFECQLLAANRRPVQGSGLGELGCDERVWPKKGRLTPYCSEGIGFLLQFAGKLRSHAGVDRTGSEGNRPGNDDTGTRGTRPIAPGSCNAGVHRPGSEGSRPGTMAPAPRSRDRPPLEWHPSRIKDDKAFWTDQDTKLVAWRSAQN